MGFVRHNLTQACLLTWLLASCAAEAYEDPQAMLDIGGTGTLPAEPSARAPEPDVGSQPSAATGHPDSLPPTAAMPLQPSQPTSGQGVADESQRRPGTAVIGACRVARIAGREAFKRCETLVETVETLTEAELFHADSREAGAKCYAWLPIGTRVSMRSTVEDGCHFEAWRAGFGASEGLPCPCEQSTEPSCEFTVEHDVYCGAMFAPDDPDEQGAQ